MSLKPFLIYIMTFFASASGLMLVVKQLSSGFGKFGKKPWIYNFGTSGLTSAIAFGFSYIIDNPFTFFWILSSIYLLGGIIFVAWANKKYFKATPNNRNKQFLAELVYALSIILIGLAAFIAMHYFLKNNEFLYYPILCSFIFFFVPIFLWHTFIAAYSIATPVYSFWTYPVDNPIPLPDEKENEQLVVMGFEIPKKPTDNNFTYFRAKAPEDILLGDLFYHFINDYNDQQSETPIEFVNEFQEGYQWGFRTKGKWNKPSRILDSSKTVKENKIKENTVIICERVLS